MSSCIDSFILSSLSFFFCSFTAWRLAISSSLWSTQKHTNGLKLKWSYFSWSNPLKLNFKTPGNEGEKSTWMTYECREERRSNHDARIRKKAIKQFGIKTRQTKAKADRAQTLIWDLMLLNLKYLLVCSGSWKVLVGLWASGSGLWTSTTWPFWHRISSLFSLWVK